MPYIVSAIRISVAIFLSLIAAGVIAVIQFGFVLMTPTRGLAYEVVLVLVASTAWWRWQRSQFLNTWSAPGRSPSLVMWSATLVAASGAVQHHWLKAGALPNEILVALDNGYGVASFVIAATLAAPLLEEALFRGALLSQLRKETNTPVAISITAVAFVAGHFELTRAPQLLIAGLLFGVITVATGRLWLAALAHSSANLFGTIEPALNLTGLPKSLGFWWTILCLVISLTALARIRAILLDASWSFPRLQKGTRPATKHFTAAT